MPSPFRFLVVSLVGAAVLASLAGRARADENLLRGPHPFRKDNQLSAHVLIAFGVNVQHAACNTGPGTNNLCGADTGDVFETLGGARWTFATPIPLVPYL